MAVGQSPSSWSTLDPGCPGNVRRPYDNIATSGDFSRRTVNKEPFGNYRTRKLVSAPAPVRPVSVGLAPIARACLQRSTQEMPLRRRRVRIHFRFDEIPSIFFRSPPSPRYSHSTRLLFGSDVIDCIPNVEFVFGCTPPPVRLNASEQKL